MVRIVVLADFHYSPHPASPKRRGEIMDVLLLRAVMRINRYIRPDVALILGDLVDDGDAPEGLQQLREVKNILDILECPCVAIPGNHDGNPDRFYRVFDPTLDFLDIKGVRILPCVDPEEPGYNASRSPRDLQRMDAAREGFDGPIVMAQHVPLHPLEAGCRYHYTNWQEVHEAMARNGIDLAISGHYHEGLDTCQTESGTFLAGPALCEAPFPFLEVCLDNGKIGVKRHELQIPADLGLIDTHVHSQFAYCGENVTAARIRALAPDMGLADVILSEHSGQLYYNEKDYWGGYAFRSGITTADPQDRRLDAYLAVCAEAGCPPDRVGLEIDCDAHGRPLLHVEDRPRFRFFNGAIHRLSAFDREPFSVDDAQEEFLALLERFLSSGIHVLAHPFRVFRRSGQETPRDLFEPTMRLLKRHGVAAEVNFHTQEPSEEFIRLCLDAGVRLSFGSDAHNLYEIGEFTPHIDLLRRCGYSGDFRDILINVDQAIADRQ
ncbi:metallophosphoesterase [bacterium]|nr:metallophosphoesterase [bacterium]